jgi:hypothetical protein
LTSALHHTIREFAEQWNHCGKVGWPNLRTLLHVESTRDILIALLPSESQKTAVKTQEPRHSPRRVARNTRHPGADSPAAPVHYQSCSSRLLVAKNNLRFSLDRWRRV